MNRVVLILKKRISILLALLLCLPALPARAEDCSAAAMILYAPDTGTVLAEKDADARMLVASTTKIMTALVVLEHCDPAERVTVTAAQTAVEGSSMYLKAGEIYTVEELLTGLLLASGNDAALALAEHTAGSVAAFAELMNAKCRSLGLANSHFVNPHGLDDPEHYSSARDLALITASAMEDQVFCRIFASPHASVHGIGYKNHNKLLTSCDGCIGGKTGYTKAAGRVLVSCVEREGLRLICVTISDPNDWADHSRAYEEAYAAWNYVALPDQGWQTLPVLSGLAEQTRLCCDCPGLLLPKSAELQLKVTLPRFVFAPVLAGAALGTLTVEVDGNTVLETEIRACDTVARDKSVALTARERFQRGWAMYCRYGLYTVYPMER